MISGRGDEWAGPPWLTEVLEQPSVEASREFALTTLWANLWLLELFEVRARTAFIGVSIPDQLHNLKPLAAALAEDIGHLEGYPGLEGLGQRAWLSPLLRSGLPRLLARGAAVAEAFHSVILEPTLAALLGFLSERASLPALGRVADEEARHWAWAVEALRRTRPAGLEEAFLDALDENALLLFATAFAEEEARRPILLLLGHEDPAAEGSAGLLAELYRRINAGMREAAAGLFGPDSRVLGLVSEYGLAKSGLC